jgi:hypothetical protein
MSTGKYLSRPLAVLLALGAAFFGIGVFLLVPAGAAPGTVSVYTPHVTATVRPTACPSP